MSELFDEHGGFRKLPGTVLKNEATGKTIYEPPQDAVEPEIAGYVPVYRNSC